MILDDLLALMRDQAITATAAGLDYDGSTALAIDLKAAADIAKGQPVYAFAKVGDADFTNCTSLAIAIQHADAQAGTGAADILSKTVLLAGLTKNKLIPLGQLPTGIAKRWLRAYVTVNGSAPNAGKLTIYLTTFRDGMPQNDVFSAG